MDTRNWKERVDDAVETDRLRRAILDALDEFSARNESGAVPNWVLVARAQREDA